MLFDSNSGQELVYFAEPITYKELKVFAMDGRLQWSVPLRDVVDSLGEVNGLTILHPDTMVFLSHYTGRTVYVDGKGNTVSQFVMARSRHTAHRAKRIVSRACTTSKSSPALGLS